MANNSKQAVYFDGVDGYVEVADDDSLSVTTTGEITISAWIRPDVLDFSITSASGDGEYVHWLGKSQYGSPNTVEWVFRMYNLTGGTRPNRISFYVFNSTGGTGVGSYFQDTLTAGQWIHVVGCIDATKTYIYKNGSPRDSDIYTATITPANTTAKMRIGHVEDSLDPGYFRGAIDDVRVYNAKLSDADVASLYAAGRGGEGPTTGLIHRWSFDETSGTSTSDQTGSLNGTLHGGASLIAVADPNSLFFF